MAVEKAADAEALRQLRAAIAACGGRPDPAARMLGLSRRGYYRELSRLGITAEAESARACNQQE
jgi:transcriptional regulator of acetoin/glycerol metabolism